MVQRKLSAFVDGELGLEQSQVVADHLAQCAACAEDYRALRQLVHWASLIPEVDPPPQFPRRIMAAALAAAAAPPARPGWSLARAVRDLRVPPQIVWAACACATAAVAIAFASMHPTSRLASAKAPTQLAAVQRPPVSTAAVVAPPAVTPAPAPAPSVSVAERPTTLIRRDLEPAAPAPAPHDPPAPRLVAVTPSKPAPEARGAGAVDSHPAPRPEAPPAVPSGTPAPATQPKSADPSKPPDTGETTMMAVAPMPSAGQNMPGGETMGMVPEKSNGGNGDKPPVVDEELQDLQKFLDQQKQKNQPAPPTDGTRRPL